MQKVIGSFFTKQSTSKPIPNLRQLQAAVCVAAQRSVAQVTEQWPATHSSFQQKEGKLQTMHGGCGGLWMVLHGHSSSINDNGVWAQVQKDPQTGKKATGDKLLARQQAFRNQLINQLRAKWDREERELLQSIVPAIAAAEVNAITPCMVLDQC